MDNSLLNFSGTESNANGSNMFLGLEWPTLMPPMSYQQNQPLPQETERIQDSILITHHLNNALQSDMENDEILLAEDITDRMVNNLGLMNNSQDEIAIDPELLTLKPSRNISEVN